MWEPDATLNEEEQNIRAKLHDTKLKLTTGADLDRTHQARRGKIKL